MANIVEHYSSFEEDEARVFTDEDVKKKREEAKAGDVEAAYWLSACLVGFSFLKRVDVREQPRDYDAELGCYVQVGASAKEYKMQRDARVRERYILGSLDSATEEELDEEMRLWLRVAAERGHTAARLVYANAYVTGDRIVEVIPGVFSHHHSYFRHEIGSNRYRDDVSSREAHDAEVCDMVANTHAQGRDIFVRAMEEIRENQELTDDDADEALYERCIRAVTRVSGLHGDAEKIWREVAEADRPEALYFAATVLIDLPYKTKLAYKCMSKAASEGSRNARHFMHLFNIGCTPRHISIDEHGLIDDTGVECPVMMNMFGTLLEHGVTCHGQRLHHAIAWYFKAMRYGNADSAYKLARFASCGAGGMQKCWKTCSEFLYRGVSMTGDHVAKHEKAMTSFLCAVAGNYLRGNADLGIKKDIKHARVLYKACAKKGDADAILALGGSNPLCAQCGAPNPKRCCADCLTAKYCDKTCQKKHWKKGDPPHRLHCAGRLPPPELKPYKPPIIVPTPAL